MRPTARSPGPAMMLAGPPLVVVATLLVARNVWAMFLLYHVGACLMWPLMDSLLVRRASWTDHLRLVGLCGGRVRAGVTIGLLLGLAMAAGQWIGFLWLGSDLLAKQQVLSGLSGWGVDPQRFRLLMGVMLLLNSPAEELYWRGFVHTHLAERHSRPRTIALTAFAYAGYHGVTLMVLMGSAPVAALLLAVVFGAGCLWGWLRERYGCVWPALLGHLGATLGYMLVFWSRFAGS